MTGVQTCALPIFINQDSYYLISGIMEEAEFKKIIENIYIRKAIKE